MSTILPDDPSPVQGSLPLYADARPLQAERHARHAVRVGGEAFGFAAHAPTVPVTVDEFERACLDYPLVFFGEDRRALAITGLTADRNLFVNEDGTYAIGAYIPAYLRRYPFVFAHDASGQYRVLCVDEGAERLVDVDAAGDGVLPLFEYGNPTALTTSALDFCQAFEAAEVRTRALADLLVELDLLEPRQATWTATRDGAPTLLLEYLTIGRERFAALDMAAIERLRAAGLLDAVYAQLLSTANWEVLSLRAAAHRGPGVDDQPVASGRSRRKKLKG